VYDESWALCSPTDGAPMLVAHYPDAVSGMGPKDAAHQRGTGT